MKKILLLLACLGFAHQCAHAQSKIGKKYLNIGYSSQTIKVGDDIIGESEIKSNFGASLSSGRTFFLNKQPIANVFYFGIDWTYLDLNYAKFKETGTYSYEDEYGVSITEYEDYSTNKAEIGMQIGPSAHVSLTDGFSVSGHLRYAPSYSLLYAEEDFSGGFGNLFTAGLSANYGPFGLGFEARWGSAKHSFSLDLEEFAEQEETVREKLKLSGSRVFLAFRF